VPEVVLALDISRKFPVSLLVPELVVLAELTVITSPVNAELFSAEPVMLIIFPLVMELRPNGRLIPVPVVNAPVIDSPVPRALPVT